jgi:hypothetical protein
MLMCEMGSGGACGWVIGFPGVKLEVMVKVGSESGVPRCEMEVVVKVGGQSEVPRCDIGSGGEIGWVIRGCPGVKLEVVVKVGG